MESKLPMSETLEVAILKSLRTGVAEFATKDVPTEDGALMESDLVKDLGCDSLDLISLFFALEAEHGVKIPEEDIDEAQLTNVGRLVEYIASKK